MPACPPPTVVTGTATPNWTSPTTRPGKPARTSRLPTAPLTDDDETDARVTAGTRSLGASTLPLSTPAASPAPTRSNHGMSRTQFSRSPASRHPVAPPLRSIPPTRPYPTHLRSLSDDRIASMTTPTDPSPLSTTWQPLRTGSRSFPPTSVTSRSRSSSGSNTRLVTITSALSGAPGTATRAFARNGSTGTGQAGASQGSSRSGVLTLKGGSGMSHSPFPGLSPFFL